jgi:LysR family glycine cleavage system transcriptional activator
MALRKFPSVAALRGFEACARHLNFSQAGVELHLTQSAISHQIRQLEELLGVELFERSGGAMSLSPHGAELLPVVRTFFKGMGAVVERFERGRQQESVLEVFVHDSFANTWLIPRLPGFYAQCPGIRIRLNTEEFSRFEDPNVQVAIKLGAKGASWGAMFCDLILLERIFPVCSPALIEAFGELATPADILKYPLILRARSMLSAERVCSPSWEYWLDRNGMSGAALNCALTVPYTSMAVLAALRGLGVAMARTSHLSDELSCGKLRRLSADEMDTTTGYHFLCAPGKEKTPDIQAFLGWLKTQVGEHP